MYSLYQKSVLFHQNFIQCAEGSNLTVTLENENVNALLYVSVVS